MELVIFENPQNLDLRCVMLYSPMHSATRFLPALAVLSAVTCSQAQVKYVPLEFRTVEGIRPFVKVQLNNTPFVFMVHGNASFYVMTTHANAAKAGVMEKRKDENFGIDAPGHVSSAGRTNTTLKLLKVGEQECREVPFTLFEVPVPGMDGMLGIGWLRANNVIVDYCNLRLGQSKTSEACAREDARLVAEGFVAHKLTWDAANRRFTVPVSINGKGGRMVVSTVSTDFVDTRFASKAGVRLGPVVYEDAGPKGATVSNWLAKSPFQMIVDGQVTAWMQPIIQDTYAYGSKPAPSADSDLLGGYLGCDFMLANQAIIDFGTGTLLIKRIRQ